MLRLFGRSLAAHVRAGRSLFALTVFGVALGVAAVLAIQIINRSSLAAFEGSIQAISGDADLTLLGRTPALADSLVPIVLGRPGVTAVLPLVRLPAAVAGKTRVARTEALFLDIVGVDFFTPIRVPWEGDPGNLAQALGQRGWAAFTPSLAQTQGWRLGDSVRVWVGSREVELIVGALVDFQSLSPLASPKLVVTDIAQAQDSSTRSMLYLPTMPTLMPLPPTWHSGSATVSGLSRRSSAVRRRRGCWRPSGST